MVCVCVLKRKWKILIPCSIVAGLYITILLAPVSIFRYCYPAIIVMPIVFSMTLSAKKKDKKIKAVH